ncbi:FMN phosphatase YigB (HAD superfamily) [Aequitasia blattaphilus]|uniref:HAD family phosphatase n=1 Tax=Aequitasia blattaphilus TaxID=2949332 RepID=A0ABT1E882_9FIRM|nr:HAD family phosphatase [Aequitasia blattaphilus]MCP1101076.1 HAD family phosphatase [Aequitasia blattaphilus]MCR8613716.1 HAD family phosphatase [Aequitasia blattaphilus]
MINLKEIDAVVFDIGNVLIHFAWEEYLDSFGFSPSTRESVAKAVFLNEDWSLGDKGFETDEWLSALIDNAPEFEKEIREVFMDFGKTIVPYPYVEEFIDFFKNKGIRTYYLSNYSDEMYLQSKEQLAFLEKMEGGVFSWKEKCIKPNPEIYDILLERYELIPEKTLFFDDLEENIKAAQEKGIKGMVFTPNIALQILGK